VEKNEERDRRKQSKEKYKDKEKENGRARLVGSRMQEKEEAGEESVFKIEKQKGRERSIHKIDISRKELRDLSRRNEERWAETIEEDIRNIQTEAQVWKFINKERRKTRMIDKSIGINEWENHFRQLLEDNKEEKEKGRKKEFGRR